MIGIGLAVWLVACSPDNDGGARRTLRAEALGVPTGSSTSDTSTTPWIDTGLQADTGTGAATGAATPGGAPGDTAGQTGSGTSDRQRRPKRPDNREQRPRGCSCYGTGGTLSFVVLPLWLFFRRPASVTRRHR